MQANQTHNDYGCRIKSAIAKVVGYDRFIEIIAQVPDDVFVCGGGIIVAIAKRPSMKGLTLCTIIAM